MDESNLCNLDKGGGVEYQRKVEYFCFYSTKWITANLQWSGADSINDTKRESITYKASVVLVLYNYNYYSIIAEEYTSTFNINVRV